MTGRTHIAIGRDLMAVSTPVLFGMLDTTNCSVNEMLGLAVLGILIAGRAATLPDIDNETSTASKRHPVLRRLVSFLQRHAKGFAHRGFFHSLFAVIPFVVAAILINRIWLPAAFISAAVGIGYASHILADFLVSDTGVLEPVIPRFSVLGLTGKPKVQEKIDSVIRVFAGIAAPILICRTLFIIAG